MLNFAIRKCLGLSLIYLLGLAPIQAVEQDQHHVRMQTNSDGTKTEFKRHPHQRMMTKTTFSKDGVVISKTVYRRGIYGKLRSCKIYDGESNELFKVAYGYDKRTSRLTAENMYSSKSGELVRILWYDYDSAGNRSKPRIVVEPHFEKPPPGLLLYLQPSAPEKDPFEGMQ